jgi:acyl-CoA dehydrogenase
MLNLTTQSYRYQYLFSTTMATALEQRLRRFVLEECIPAEGVFARAVDESANRWATVPPIVEELKTKAKGLGLWNLWLPAGFEGSPGLSNEQ